MSTFTSFDVQVNQQLISKEVSVIQTFMSMLHLYKQQYYSNINVGNILPSTYKSGLIQRSNNIISITAVSPHEIVVVQEISFVTSAFILSSFGGIFFSVMAVVKSGTKPLNHYLFMKSLIRDIKKENRNLESTKDRVIELNVSSRLSYTGIYRLFDRIK